MSLSTACALVAATCVCLFASPLGRLLGVMDIPDGQRKIHARPTPLMGGLAALVAVAVAYAACVPSHWSAAATALSAGALLFLLGFFDDRNHLPPYLRLALTAVIVVAACQVSPEFLLQRIHFKSLAATMALGSVAGLFTCVAIVGLIFAVNMADGANGLAPGMLLTWSMLLLTLVPVDMVPADMVPVVAGLCVGMAVVLAFNLSGRLFLGDSGTYAITGLIALLTTYIHSRAPEALPAGAIVVWFMVPVLDCIRLIVSRRMRGRSPFTPDRNHLHHMLMDILPPKLAVASYVALVAVPSAIVTVLPNYALATAAVLFLALGAIWMSCALPQPSSPRTDDVT